jgi:hypothetical protein
VNEYTCHNGSLNSALNISFFTKFIVKHISPSTIMQDRSLMLLLARPFAFAAATPHAAELRRRLEAGAAAFDHRQAATETRMHSS